MIYINVLHWKKSEFYFFKMNSKITTRPTHWKLSKSYITDDFLSTHFNLILSNQNITNRIPQKYHQK